MKAAALRSHDTSSILPTMLENCQSIEKQLIYLKAWDKALGQDPNYVKNSIGIVVQILTLLSSSARSKPIIPHMVHTTVYLKPVVLVLGRRIGSGTAGKSGPMSQIDYH